MKTTLWVLLGIVLGSCATKSMPDTPEGVYQAFYGAILESDWETAVGMLSPELTAAFRSQGERMLKRIGLEMNPLDFYLQNVVASPSPLRSIEVVAREEGGALLRTKAGPCGESQPCEYKEIRMRRVEGRWVVAPEIPAILRATVQPGGEKP